MSNHKIGLIAAISYTIGDIVGSGIFVSPTSILNHTGSVGLSLCVWALCAFISLFGALCYIELGTTIRKSGNDFAFLSHFGWHPIAAAFMWTSVTLSYPSTMAIQAITLGEYVVTGLNNWIDMDPSSNFYAYRLIGFSVIWPLMFLNFFSLRKVAASFQIAATGAKLLVSAIIIVTGMYFLIFKQSTSNFQNSFSGTVWKPDQLVLGVYSGLFAYNGWDVLNFGAEEIENPRRTLPIAALTGIFISATVFILMNVSYFTVLTVQEFKESPAVAVIFAEKTLGDFQYAVPFLISVLLVGSLNTGVFACSRYMYAGAKSHVVPSPFRLVHTQSKSPRIAVFAEVLIAIGLSFIGNLDQIISYMSFALWSQRTFTQIGFIYFKWNGKLKQDDAFTVPIFVPIVFLFICIALLVIPAYQDFYVAIYGLSLIVGGFIIYFIFILPKRLPSFLYVIDGID
ncbi:unnamed protein product [Caenorhabditis auriculariae]|uniref:Uncharacterized protein n=1 Tax=Caenorhabditis auriculariae TaxID=2777116 RepID=A0A8S1H3D4_9PELO|nr:unnamed protein product [Caenorhabditis auriculariae]